MNELTLKPGSFLRVRSKKKGINPCPFPRSVDYDGGVPRDLSKFLDRSSIFGLPDSPKLVSQLVAVEAAIQAVEHGASAIMVSNHGGRQLDCVPATVSYLDSKHPFTSLVYFCPDDTTLVDDAKPWMPANSNGTFLLRFSRLKIDVLPEIVRAVESRCEVYVDGGVRLGTDVVKAIALGARAVFVGRPVLYGLAYSGAEQMGRIIRSIANKRDELQVTDALMLVCAFTTSRVVRTKLLLRTSK
ncbi:hypothetical protein HPB51_025045 [Rhipicephalus microplus]|uniref:FMN hydroxy acid dehydrogenase domain-containing protein n=1 Tax=Rhipicephalus microplus TaxID=6941 RepID=A0A9J6EV78_RHIMP|nr:hypothetical protein HPB51_025045 [Rhipicephalus microplus]